MKISYNWLKQYINLDYSVEELENKLTFAGIEVEDIKILGDNLKQITIAEIIEKKKHPEADKLSVCSVNDGKEILQIVCGAPNCNEGKKVALAPIGASIGDFKIKKAKLRGVLSFGMLCSEKELGISDNHDGIMILPDDAPVGETLAEFLKISDAVYDVEITPNRPDLLGMIGVARDLSALINVPVSLPEFSIQTIDEDIFSKLALDNQAPDLCTRYTAKVIKNVTVSESPEWLKNRLLSIGLRPINNIVDITNYVMMEYGHPLHAFDYDKISGKKIVVRRALDKENFNALDDNDYELKSSDLVIADAEKPVALAGVIGGSNSQISTNTKTVVLEAANFLYSTVRKSAGRMNIVTDSGYRFERNLSDAIVEEISNRAAALIVTLAGGVILKGTLDSYPVPAKNRIVELRTNRVRTILGISISKSKIVDYLIALGLKFLDTKSSDENLAFEIPSNRRDLTREIDLIEEIIRLHGYNNVPTKMKIQNIMNREAIFSRRDVKNILVNHGFSETLHWNFGDPADLDNLNISADDDRRNYIELKNPLGSSYSILRPLLLPTMLNNAAYNVNHGAKNIKTFEIAKVFSRGKKALSCEEYHVTGIMIGNLFETHWSRNQEEVDFFDLKGVVEEILDNLSLKEVEYKKSSESFYQKGIGADVVFKGKTIGSLGKIDKLISEKYDLENSVFSFDLNLDLIKSLQKNELPVFEEIPKFPPVLRDLSFVIAKDITAIEIIKTIKKVNDNIIKDVILFDVYEGEHIEAGFRSLSVNLVFSSNKKTLTDGFISKIINKIINSLQNNYNIKMR